MNKFTVTGKTRIAFAVIIIIMVIMSSYNFVKSNFEDNIKKNGDLTEKLEIGAPQYVGFEEIKTGDYNFEKDNYSSYSQIEIKNISHEVLYEISVEMAEQETVTKNKFILPKYYTSILQPGESALLSCQHENVKNDKPLNISQVYYTDFEGNSIIISGLFDKGESRNIKVKPNIKTKFISLSEDIKKINIGKISISNEGDNQIVGVDVTNTSAEKLYDVYVNFQEYYNGKVVGNLYSRLEVLDQGVVRTIKIKTIPNTELKISDIGYRLKTDDNPKGHVYSIYPNQKIYKRTPYGSALPSQTSSSSVMFARLAAIIIFLEANRREAVYRIKAIKEGNNGYFKKASYASIIKWITLAIYIGLVADLFIK